MKEDRYIVSQSATNDLTVDDSTLISSQIPQTSGNLALETTPASFADHPTCGTPPECMPVTPAAGCITSLIDFHALNEKRKQTGKSYQTIADALDMSKATVSRFFSGQAPNPSLYNTIRIFGFLGLSIDEAAGITKPTPPPTVETDHDMLRKLDHLEYAVEVKDKHIADLQHQLVDAVEMRDKYKKYFMDETERQRNHYESEIEKIRSRAAGQFKWSMVIVLVLIAVLTVYLITDLCLPDRGLFQYTGLI